MTGYKVYKDSIIPWIGQIPAHWETRRAKYMFKKEKRDVRPEDRVITCFRDGQVTLRENRRTTGFTESITEVGYQGIRKGDLVIHQMDAFAGSIGVSDSDGKGTSVYHCCTPTGPYIPQYYAYALREMARAGFIQSLYRGIRERSSDFNFFTFGRQFLPVPPIEEQKRIVAYLDKKITLIESCKCQRERELQTLNELKQAEIASVVTRGLNPNVPMAYMDTPLRTMHPAHWKRVRNMTFLVDQSEKVGKRSDDYQLLSLTTNGVIVRDVESGKGKFPKDFETYKVVEPGELVFCLFDIDETPRTVGLSNNYGMITGAYDVFKVKDSIVNPSYVYAFYLVVDNIKALRPYYSGLRKVVKHNRFMQIGFPLPPIEEQNAIVDYIRSKTCKIDSMIEALKQEIERLTEYKQRLISDVVTGQIDVRSEEIA